jgi:hypothetical protein
MNFHTNRDTEKIILHTALWSGFEKLINPMISPLVYRYKLNLLCLSTAHRILQRRAIDCLFYTKHTRFV